MDLSLFSLINGTHTPWADELMLLASAVGRGGFVWIATAIIAAVFPRLRMAAWRVILSVALTFLLVDGVIKPIVHRERPFQVLPDARLIDTRPLTGSFPSGHAASAAAGALSVGRLLPLRGSCGGRWPLRSLCPGSTSVRTGRPMSLPASSSDGRWPGSLWAGACRR